MASRKLTQLPTATEVTTSDKIYIVDVSDTSESPQGTSKQALISELPVVTSLTSTDGSISIDNTDPSAPDLSIASGEWTPVFTSLSNLDSVDVFGGLHSKSGNVVTCSAVIRLNFSTGQTNGSANFSLPIEPTNDFEESQDLILTGSPYSSPLEEFITFQATAIPESKVGNIDFTCLTAGAQITLSIFCQYTII